MSIAPVGPSVQQSTAAGSARSPVPHAAPTLWLLLFGLLLLSGRANAATVSWVGDSGNWNSPTNWSTGVLPGPTDDVVIDVLGSVTVTHNSGNHAVNSILCQESFTLTGGSLAVSNSIQVNGGFTLGGTLSGGTLLPSSGGQPVVANGGTLSGVTLASDIVIGNGNHLYVANGLTFVGGATITLDSAASTTVLYITPGFQTFSGTGQILLAGTSSNNRIRLGQGGGTAVTLGPGVTIRGRGFIDQSSSATLINQGTIQADVSGQTLTISPDSFSNDGVLRVLEEATLTISSANWNNDGQVQVDNGTLNLGGNFTGFSATTGLDRNGGTVNITGTLHGGLTLDGASGSWNLSGTINGGTLAASGGAQLLANGGTLSGVTLASDIVIGNGNTLWIANGLTFSGGATITLDSTANTTYLFVTPGFQTFGGSGQILLAGTSSNNRVRLGQGGGTTLTLAPGVTIRGRGFIDQSSSATLINQGTIQADVSGQTLTVSPDSFRNDGVLRVLDGATLTISSANWNNDGQVQVDSGTLNLGGNFTGFSATTGLDRNGGTVNITGTLHGGLTLNAATGSWNLSGTINGGTLAASGGAQLLANGGTLSGVTLASDIVIGNGNSLFIANGLTFSGGATITLEATANSTVLYVTPGFQTFSGSGQILLAGTSSNNRIRLGQGGGTTLTLGPGVTIRGRGFIDQSSSATLINQGTIQADVSGQTLAVSPDSFSNDGVLRVLDGATLTISSANWNNDGQVQVDNGTLNLGGNFTGFSATTGLDRTGGTVNITGTLHGGLTLDGSTGPWNLSGTINGGTLAASGGAQLLANGGTLSGVTLASDIIIGNGNHLYIANGLTFVGGATITLDSAANTTYLYLTPGFHTFSGSGQILLAGTSSNNRIRLGQGGGTTLTLAPGVTMRGRGFIDQSSSATLINQGTIQADVSGQTLTISPDSFSNDGVLRVLDGATLTISSANWNNDGQVQVDNGTLNLGGNFTGFSATTGLDRNGGTVNITGTLHGGLTLDAATGPWNLSGTINGGTLAASDGAQLLANGGTLSAVTLASDIVIDNNNSLFIANGLTFSGGATITLNAAANTTYLYVTPGFQTLSGAGQILLAGTSSNNRIRLGHGGGTTLTLGPGVTIRGRGFIDQSSSATLINQGTIQADVSGQTLTVSPDSFSNDGVLRVLEGATLTISSANWNNDGQVQVDNGTLNLGGNFTGFSATTGLDRNGGTVNITGTLHGGLTLHAATGSWNLSGTINGGTLAASGGAQLLANGGTLSGLTLASDIVIANANHLWIANGLTFVGGSTITLEATANSTVLYVTPGFQTFSGSGQIVLGGTSSNNRIRLGQGGGTTLTLGPGVTVRGRGFIDQSSSATLINEGTIQTDVSGQPLTLSLFGFINRGHVSALPGGTIQVQALLFQTDGTLHVVIQGTNNFGRITTTGVLQAGGSFEVATGLDYLPQAGVAFPVMAFGSLSGGFDEMRGLSLGQGLFFQPTFTASALVLSSLTDLPPVLALQPASQSVPVGETAMFGAEAIGPGPMSYQWYRDGLPLPGQTGPTLTLGSVQLSDAGGRRVVASNPFGSVTSVVAMLTVLLPPNILVQPSGANVAPDSPVTFSVQAEGTPPLRYQWRRNGANIPGATGASYTIPSVQVADGGRYSVVVANPAGAITSNPAQLVVLVPQLAPGDDFAQRVMLPGASGVISFSNTLATREAGEPNHAGKAGGRSVWYVWRAPADGVAEFSLAGSSFDTLLAVYTGNSLTSLAPIADDDDGGGFLTSAVEFNVVSQTEYAIAIDGFAGAAGYYALSWMSEAAEAFPVIVSHPASLVIPSGTDATFTVVSDGTAFQWFFNGTPIPGATSPTLTVPNANSAQAGSYVVRVSRNGRSVDSAPAVLEIGQASTTFSQNKFEDLFGAGGGQAGSALPAAASPGFVPVTGGPVTSRVMNNLGSMTQLGEPNHCGVIGGASKWFGLSPTENGVLAIDTVGSAIDTVLAVYTGTDLLSLTMIACDDSSAPDGFTSQVRFPAALGENYAVVVDGVNGAQGNIRLNWRLGRPPTVVSAPVTRGYPPGQNVILSVDAGEPTGELTFQWQRDGRNLFGASQSTLALTNLQAAHAGTYSVVVGNFAGSSTNLAGVINLAAPVLMGFQLVESGGGIEIHLSAPQSQGFVLQGTTDFIQWTPLHTNTTLAPFVFADPGQAPRRFYRLWPWP